MHGKLARMLVSVPIMLYTVNVRPYIRYQWSERVKTILLAAVILQKIAALAASLMRIANFIKFIF